MRKVYDSANLIDAHLVSSRLQSEGIGNLVQGGMLTGALGELPVNATPTVWVLDERDADRALALLAEWQRSTATDPPGEWRCPHCGERQAGSFEICWSCGQEPGADK